MMHRLKIYGWMAALLLLCACARHAALPPPVDLAPSGPPSAPPSPPAASPSPPPPAKIESPVLALTPADLSRIAVLVPADIRWNLSDSAADGLARLVERTLETGPSGRAVPWALDQSSGTITPKPLRRTPLAAQCRDISFASGGQVLNSTACKGTDGRWALKP